MSRVRCGWCRATGFVRLGVVRFNDQLKQGFDSPGLCSGNQFLFLVEGLYVESFIGNQ